MKKTALLLASLLVVAGIASASQATAPAKPAKPMTKTHVIEAEVVSVDATAKTLTVKTEKGETTAKVEGAALTSLKTLKAGEKVKLTCRDNEKGEHEAVTHVTVEKAPKM